MRAFIAIPLPEKMRDEISRRVCSRIDKSMFRVVRPENLHITLKFLGEVGREEAERVISLIQSLEFGPFSVTVGGIGAFPSVARPRVVWVGAHANELFELQRIVDSGTVDIRREFREFRPHITVARIRRGCRPVPLGLNTDVNIGVFVADRVVLYESVLRGGGPEYTEVAVRWF